AGCAGYMASEETLLSRGPLPPGEGGRSPGEGPHPAASLTLYGPSLSRGERTGFDRNTVVWASAGTGKTRKLVDVYLELLEQGVDPLRIVAVTFTEKAAAEMRERIRSALYTKPGQWMKTIALLPLAPISTIHGFCGMLIREHAIDLGIDPSFTILDEQRSLDLAREAARESIRREIRNGNEEVEQLFGDFGLDSLVETIVR